MLSVDVEQEDGGAARVTVRGELDIASAPELDDRLHRLEAADRPIVVDLAAMTMIDSSGLRVLLEGWQRSRLAGRSFSVIPPHEEQPLRTFRVTGLDALLPRDGDDES